MAMLAYSYLVQVRLLQDALENLKQGVRGFKLLHSTGASTLLVPRGEHEIGVGDDRNVDAH